MKTLLTITNDITNYQIKTDNQHPVYLIKKEYSDEEYEIIQKEADEWAIEHVHEKGHDYGTGQYDSQSKTTMQG